ncbi:uncharacterized protein OCT59_015817 [Rhizophagus irregularis]|uniref:uncharacterized protein n=1 Tax=Rhizophagus irregularis TaxID=588596 RepID=UPI000CB14CA8|nr:hypothetical protein OCT59_015817 [Rhizophagus irregularis]GBC30642.1 hypothetical protein GLOIN_2v1475879 [Rhizophagus irregularis DAOM 181602=DAOM 197198]
MSSNATNIERRNDNNKNNKICFNCKRPRHYARNCRAPRTPRTPREVKSKPLTTRSQNTRISKRTRVFKHKETKSKKKVAWSEEDDYARTYANAEQEVFSIPGTSVIEDVQYAISLLNEQYKAETWPDQFKPKYDLSLTEEVLVAGRNLIEFSNLTAKLHQELNYDPYWAINETSRILSKIRGVAYDDDDLEWYDLGERDNSIEDNAPNRDELYERIGKALAFLKHKHDNETPEMWYSRVRGPFTEELPNNPNNPQTLL